MNIHQILDRASSLRIAVVGDLILDRYITGEVTRISPEAPVPILHIINTRQNDGGAGNVAANLRGLGVQVSTFYGYHVPIKTRIMSGNHHLLRLDEEEEPKWMYWGDYDIGLGYGIQNGKFDVVVISDYCKGAISEDVAENIIFLCGNHGIPVVVDSKQEPWMFKGCNVFKCNKKEWDRIGDSPDSCIDGGLSKFIVITNGEHGMSLYYHVLGECDGEGIGGHPTEISDTCGAGDTVTAIIAMMQGIKSDEPNAIAIRNMLMTCTLANIAASEVCRHPGVVPITKDLLIKRFNEVNP